MRIMSLELKHKRGVIVPLTAVILGVVIFIVFALGVDARLAKGSRTKSALHLEEACRQAVRQLPITRNALEVFQGQMRVFLTPKNSGGLGGLPLSKDIELRLVSPTLSRILGNTSTPALNQTPCPFPLAPLIGCRFFGNLNIPAVSVNYPGEPFWNIYAGSQPRRNDVMGDTVACEISMNTRALRGESSGVVARSVWQLKPRGAGNGQPLSTLPIIGARQQRGGGVLIGIATQMGVRLKRTGPPPAINTRFLLNSPAADPVRPFGTTANAFLSNRQSSNWSGSTLLPSSGLAPAPNNAAPLSLEERRATCANPAIFTRNVMLTAIVERAARGWLRDKTEIISINSLTYGGLSAPTTSNEPPTIIVRGGQDLTARQYQLPAVTFREVRGPNATPINPTTRGTGLPSSATVDRERFGQLRDCFHVYSGGSTGIPRPSDSTLVNYLARVSFEPRVITQQTELLTPAPLYNPASSLDWDQGLASPRPLTAGQAVGMLGATRFCPSGPTHIYPNTGPGGPITGTCTESPMRTSTATPYTDLRPDIVNFLEYAIGNARAHPMPGPANPVTPGPGTELTFSNFSHVVLFTHIPITQAEIPEIATRVRALNSRGRYVTVIYIPTNFLDATVTEIARYKQAFLAANPAIAGSQDSRNIVFQIWPRSSAFGAGGLAEDTELRSFWSDLLQQQPNNAVARAKWIWLPRLMYEELKF